MCQFTLDLWYDFTLSFSAGGLSGRKQRPASPASVPERPGQCSDPRHSRRGVSTERGPGGHGADLLHPGDNLLGTSDIPPTCTPTHLQTSSFFLFWHHLPSAVCTSKEPENCAVPGRVAFLKSNLCIHPRSEETLNRITCHLSQDVSTDHTVSVLIPTLLLPLRSCHTTSVRRLILCSLSSDSERIQEGMKALSKTLLSHSEFKKSVHYNERVTGCLVFKSVNQWH